MTSALANASKNALVKHHTRKTNTFVITWAWLFYSLLILVPIMLVKGAPVLDSIFWKTLAVLLFLDTVAYLFYVKALKLTDLSLALPMLTLTPFFVLLTGLVINHEFPRPLGILGVMAIVTGAYWLNFKRGASLWRPFSAIYHDKGVSMMFLVALIWSFTAPLQKLAILHSNPYFFAGFEALCLTIIFTPLAWQANKEDLAVALKVKNIPRFIPIGLFDGIGILCQMIGQSLASTVLIISLKRTSIVFSSILGWLIFGEKIRSRVLPIIVMIVGVVLISIS